MSIEVRPTGDEWELRHFAVVVDRYPTEAEAEAHARRLAKRHRARLEVDRGDGRFQTDQYTTSVICDE